MKIHPGVKPAVWGAVAGAVAFAVVGFSSLGWTLGSTAEKMATQRAEAAVVAALAPICVEKFTAPGRCTGEIGRVQQGFVMEPAIGHREGRLGYHARKRYTKFGSCYCLRRKARQPYLEARPFNRAMAQVGSQA